MTSEPKASEPTPSDPTVPDSTHSQVNQATVDSSGNPSDSSSDSSSGNSSRGWLLGLALSGMLVVGAAVLLAQRPAATPEPTNAALTEAEESGILDTPLNDEEAAVNDEQAVVDDEQAAALAEWEAQMQQINTVVQSRDRTTLIGDSPTKGPLDATVILLKFSDFECPYCAIASADMKTFTANHEDDVLYVYKHFPLVSIHDEALPAAKAAWAAGQQDQFWLYHDGLFAFQEKLSEDYYVELANQIGLDMEQFNRDRNSPEAEAAAAQDTELALQLGLGGTPSFLMTNLSDSLPLPGGAPLELFDEATARLEAAAAE